MLINTKTMVSMTEANQNFSKVTKLVDKNGSAVILKNNMPKYIIFDFSQLEKKFDETVSDEDIMAVSKQFIEKYRKAYEVLAE